jgi:hypothetical protein
MIASLAEILNRFLGIRTKAMRTALTDMIPAFIAGARARLQNGKDLQTELNKSLHELLPVSRTG